MLRMMLGQPLHAGPRGDRSGYGSGRCGGIGGPGGTGAPPGLMYVLNAACRPHRSASHAERRQQPPTPPFALVALLVITKQWQAGVAQERAVLHQFSSLAAVHSKPRALSLEPSGLRCT